MDGSPPPSETGRSRASSIDENETAEDLAAAISKQNKKRKRADESISRKTARLTSKLLDAAASASASVAAASVAPGAAPPDLAALQAMINARFDRIERRVHAIERRWTIQEAWELPRLHNARAGRDGKLVPLQLPPARDAHATRMRDAPTNFPATARDIKNLGQTALEQMMAAYGIRPYNSFEDNCARFAVHIGVSPLEPPRDE